MLNYFEGFDPSPSTHPFPRVGLTVTPTHVSITLLILDLKNDSIQSGDRLQIKVHLQLLCKGDKVALTLGCKTTLRMTLTLNLSLLVSRGLRSPSAP